MTINTLKDMVASGKTVSFTHYHDGSLWYITECGFTFPVPVSDTGIAIFLNKDKAVMFMRWIRKHIELTDIALQEKSKQENSNGV